MNPFEIINSINNKTRIEIEEKKYSAFIVNRGLSYFIDTVMHANEMNMSSHISNQMQYDFYYNGVRKRKRYSKWAKKEIPSETIKNVQKKYNCSKEKAYQYHSLLNKTEIEKLNNIKGGL